MLVFSFEFSGPQVEQRGFMIDSRVVVGVDIDNQAKTVKFDKFANQLFDQLIKSLVSLPRE